jgi:uncharacterized protein YndB with AHSA1/START domain
MTDTINRDTLTDHELRFERLLNAPVATVWKYLTDPELRASWFMGGSIDDHAGGKIEFVFDHDRLSDGDVPAPEKYCRMQGHRWTEDIVDYDAPHVIAYTFDAPDSIARFTLADAGGGRTLLTLVHSGIADRGKAANYGGGWTSHLEVLAARVDGGGVADFWALHARNEAMVKARLA